MAKQFKQYKGLNLPKIDQEILSFWKDNNIFKRSISEKPANNTFVFYEGPPGANGKPGIHHVISRAVKDVFCRFQTMQGKRVERKGGWDTHGLPVEITAEKELGINKEDIGTKISIEDYNKKCREVVMTYKNMWDDLTMKMGYWVDLENPYITYENDYIESVWHLLQKIYENGYLYKGYTIQPFSPAAGTGLSSHEINQPGCYRDVKDNSMVAQFKVVKSDQSAFLFDNVKHNNVFFIAWTTTPWTLPSNTALAVGPKIKYVRVATYNQYTSEPIVVILAEELLGKWFKKECKQEVLGAYGGDIKNIPYQVLSDHIGSDFELMPYEQLMPYVQPENGDAFKVLLGDFVSTADGTGIVHLAPSFGADDMKVAKKYGFGSLTLVDKQGKFVDEVDEFAGRYVKDYKDEGDDYKNVDVDIIIKLKQENRAFKSEKYSHNYPHCWRTGKPILYYPLDSWIIKATAVKERMQELNNTINWKPKHTGEGRFGSWLENLQDWNLSRSRYWGIPLPIWRTEDSETQICIGSINELQQQIDKANKVLGLNQEVPDDLHRPFIDDVTLVSDDGEEMKRETDLIDVWFDSGAMPYAQWHYPFENKEIFNQNFPADFIAEGVDQTRGWFYTLHAIATMCFDSVAFKNVISNGLVQDKKGQKMSKSLGNTVDPFTTIASNGADATRLYMLSNSNPWDNLKFDADGISEVSRKFFGTLYNTYGFFALYANIDGFNHSEKEIPVANRPEIDQWIISILNTLVKEVTENLADYEPTKAARSIMNFVDRNLSNWYVRLCRRRFWKGAYNEDKIAAYQTLYHCLETVALLMAPFAPFYSDHLFQNLNNVSGKSSADSVHLANYPTANDGDIDSDLEERMSLAQDASSLIHSLRKREKIKVRQPLAKVLIPALTKEKVAQVEAVKHIIIAETNVKEIEGVSNTEGVFTKKLKPIFNVLGPKYGQNIGKLKVKVEAMDQAQIAKLELEGKIALELDNTTVDLLLNEVDVATEDAVGWAAASEGGVTVALDVTLTEALINEGLARELVNKLQRLRKDLDFNVTDRVILKLKSHLELNEVIKTFKEYICAEILADELEITDEALAYEDLEINDLTVQVKLLKH